MPNKLLSISCEFSSVTKNINIFYARVGVRGHFTYSFKQWKFVVTSYTTFTKKTIIHQISDMSSYMKIKFSYIIYRFKIIKKQEKNNRKISSELFIWKKSLFLLDLNNNINKDSINNNFKRRKKESCVVTYDYKIVFPRLKIIVTLGIKFCPKLNVIFTFQYNIFQLCSIIITLYIIPKEGNKPITYRGNLVKVFFLLTI
jgi:hypothetical protein